MAKALLWALLNLTVIQHLLLIKLSGVSVIKTKERSATDLWNFPGLVFSFGSYALMKTLCLIRGFLKIGLLSWICPWLEKIFNRFLPLQNSA